MTEKVGILGGTFNPVHNGHLALAKAALTECGLSKIIFMPNGNPPHKSDFYTAPAQSRFEMVRLAIQNTENFELSDYEIQKKSPSYTIDTLSFLKSRYESEFYFIIGADSLYTLHYWKDYNRLLRECRFIVADRNCKEGSDIYAACMEFNRRGGNTTLLKMKRRDVTSTFLRECIQKGADIKKYVPEGVYEYIIRHNLYQAKAEEENDN